MKHTEQPAHENDCTNETRRKEQRYYCLNFPVIYSAAADSSVSQLGKKLHEAILHDMSIHGLSFDIPEQLHTGDKLLIMLRYPDITTTEVLETEVCWCNQLDDQQYRVGVSITGYDLLDTDISIMDPTNLIKSDTPVPTEITIYCPSCCRKSRFSFVDNQTLYYTDALMPLYNCNICHGTRSLPGLLYNARHLTTENKDSD